MKLDGFSDEGLGFCHSYTGGNTTGQIRNIRREIAGAFSVTTA
jgi:hypothetical protein